MNHIGFVVLLLVAITMLTMQPSGFAQTACRVVNLKFHHPDVTHPGEMIETTSIVTASCFHFDTIILDLVDSKSNAIISRASWFFDPRGNTVSPPLINFAGAPTQLGYWALAIFVYFAGSSTGIQFTILIQPNA